ncbi:MAG: UDP-glucose/GDP-mannose dehydrogenase family protein [Patescibacteria group bacterium]|nr:MAG: UDP-glucose/GDP-mannose dehydrogenase family protein [Patescibacteria group bacterium]
MKLTFVGAGYVGLTSAAVFADLGHKVRVLDVDEEKIKVIMAGKEPFFEPGLGVLIQKGLRSKNLIPTTLYKEAIPEAEVVFICVGTPSRGNGEADLSYVFSAAADIGENLGGRYTVVVVKSTVPPGTTGRVAQLIGESGDRVVGKDFDVVDSPEFLAEGRAVKDTQEPSRIIIGADSDKPVKVLRRLLASFDRSPLLVCDIRSAELVKYASNAFLATKVSFINEMAQIAERVGADVVKVAEGMGLDDRIGPRFLRAGLGYGGSCFPKDVASLLAFSDHAGYEFGILRAANFVNREQHQRFAEKIKEGLGGLKGKRVAVLGLAFKPKSDDMRKAVSVEIINTLLKQGAEVSVFDPIAMPNAKKMPGWVGKSMIKWAEDAYNALDGADCLALVTEWAEFSDLDWGKVKELMRGSMVADGRNFYDPAKIRKAGFDYVGMGRGKI